MNTKRVVYDDVEMESLIDYELRVLEQKRITNMLRNIEEEYEKSKRRVDYQYEAEKRYGVNRVSLAQEIRDLLKNNGHWTPEDWAGPDLITAIGMLVEENKQLREDVAFMAKELQESIPIENLT